MAELTYLQDDIDRFSTLHSWYKHGELEVVPLLNFGQQPRHPISPETDKELDNQLRWWYLYNPNFKEYEKMFPNKQDALMVWNASQMYIIQVDDQFGSSSVKGLAIKKQFNENSIKFYDATKQIYEKLKKAQTS